jgi:NADH-quinone oxidoreductase subunit N
MYVAPGLTAAKLLVTLAALFVLLSSEQYVREQRRHTLEFAIMLASALLMLLVLINANKLIVTFLTVGGFSLCLYILILFDIVAKASREAALKYFYLSTLSTGLILFGSFLFYVANKETQFGELLTLLVYTPTADALVLSQAAIVFVLTGLFFKLSAFPAHLWAVDVYEGSPAPVMAFFILPVKIAVFFALIRILNTAFVGYENIWLPCLSLAAVGSLAWGAFAAAQERKITRFLGYASINQLGFLLLAAATTTDKATNAIVLYLVLYALMTGGFLLAFIHARRYDNHNLIYISDLRGFAKLERLLSWNVATALFSMAGVPPLGGFFGKYLIIDAALCGGLYAQVVVALATSVISTFYYLQIIKAFWFEETPATNPVRFFLSSLQRNLLSGKAALLWIGPVFIPLIITAPAPVVTALTSSSGLSAAIF